MQLIEVKDLVPGMVLGNDIFSSGGALLLAKGTVISESSIFTLQTYYIFDVYVESDSIPAENVQEHNSRSEKIKNSDSFKDFKVHYDNTITDVSDEFNDIITKNSDKIDTDELLSGPIKLMNGKSILEMFDMLHVLRTYDDSTFVHSVNVSIISSILAKWSGFSDKNINLAMLCGLLHDIGKITISDEIIRKPGKLTPEEFEVVKNHTKNGYDILKRKAIDRNVPLAALMHHERCDGSGYPENRKGPEINPFAKIVAIADVYDAMTSARCYRGAVCPFTVIDILIDEGLQKYDPKLIMTFLSHMGETYLNNRVRLSNDEIGEIVFVDPKSPSRPLIKADGGTFIDLKKNDLKIEEIL
jgi:putative nucleotidyltransferase with HDIG domain